MHVTCYEHSFQHRGLPCSCWPGFFLFFPGYLVPEIAHGFWLFDWSYDVFASQRHETRTATTMAHGATTVASCAAKVNLYPPLHWLHREMLQ
ncbi:hypothetical protein DM01DRAFT_53422 [Hesseltinella vesiculosa]|uniref:Uncharacterized protein n=1 Tax=Hesseltinella vesiculosa TaxID=101127 RepID=A0A1X2GLS0_9FUNG|nr:hypothetical protein DM01DRAFT_53422 [Hesseltinella vesiculosa]